MRLAEYWRSAPARIAASYALLFALSVFVLLAVILWSTSRELNSQLREAIQQDIRIAFETYREQGAEGLMQDIRERSRNVEGQRTLYLLEDAQGNALAGNVDVIAPFKGWQELYLPRPAPKQPGHAIVFGARIEGLFLLVGRRTNSIWEVQEILLKSFAWALGATLLLALLGGVLLGHRALRRVEAIGAATRKIVEGDLSRRVPVAGTRGEIDRLAIDINQMLQQIEHLMDGLKQVTNDIAHDLRTPLGRLQQRLDTARRKETSLAGLQDCLDLAVEEIDKILATFNAMLQIAQIESGARRARFADASLSDIGRTIFEVYESVAEDNGQRLACAITDGVTLRGDRDLLTQLLANLVENAIRHTPPGSRIALAVRRDAGRPCLVVADTGPGVPPDERERVFRRFYRLDSSRTTPGSGLGLALVHAIANLHSATVELADNAPGLVATVRFPAP